MDTLILPAPGRTVRRHALAFLAAVWAALPASESFAFICGDSVCSGPAENSCNCPFDCGAPPATEGCSVGFPPNPRDEDCDGMIDCADPDCITLSSQFGTVPCGSCGNGACAGCELCGGCSSCSFDCAPVAGSETNCADGLDDDCSGTADCADVQCLSSCCGIGACDPAEDHCNCAADCGPPPATEISCIDGRDNDCDGAIDCPDSECFSQSVCCGNGTCSLWEHACNCPADCGPPAGSETVCNDLLDDDCDGLTDCGDSECFGQPQVCGDDVCTSPPENSCNCPNDCGLPPTTEFCGTSTDFDCDGMVGCSDPDCPSFFGFPCDSGCGNGICAPCERCGPCPSCVADCGPPVASETNCTDGIDNDCNGKADCSDLQCLSACCGDGTCDPAESSCNCSVDCGCATSSEIQCLDGRDNDCDGVTDCAEAECQGGTETNCTDGLDDDCDGAADCADSDCCSGSPACLGDCLCCGLGGCDPQEDSCSCPEDCGASPATEGAGSACQDGIDNDCDGRTDCYDADCYDVDGDGFAAPPCGTDCNDGDATTFPVAPEICGDTFDNDCDNSTDCADSDCFGQTACCGDGYCDLYEWCTCPADCGTQTSEAGFCFDFADNDCDGVIDCQDRDCCLSESSCHQSSGCGNGSCQFPENKCSCQCDCGYPAAVETACSDNADEDCDGLLDCYDPDCFGPDADGDGFRADVCSGDCNDADALTHPGAAEVCNDAADNDCDGRTDCADLADCVGDSACCDGDGMCESFETSCTCAADCGNPASSEAGQCFDGSDNDCDGVADCDDFDCCFTEQFCQGPGCGDGQCSSAQGENKCTCQCDCGPPSSTEGSCANNGDDDCDGAVDCGDVDCQGIDSDGDGFAATPCGPDCNDANNSIYPGAAETCNDGMDNDCDGASDCTDSNCIGTLACEACCSSLFGTFFGCGYAATGSCPLGGPRGPGSVCDAPEAYCVYFSNPFGGGTWGCQDIPAICGGTGSHGAGSTCAALPTREIVCNDGIDDECDGLVDCGDPDCTVDADGDGTNAAPCGSDCADADPCATAGGAENCADGIDNDCDFSTDCADAECQVDADNDGYMAPPCGADCNDTDSSVNPAATEACTDTVDNDCDGTTDCGDADCQVDADADGYLLPPCGNDCDDADSGVYPGATELCDDEVDNDCDTTMDCDDTDCAADDACATPPAVAPDPAGGKTRVVSFSAPPPSAATGGSSQTAVRITMLDLQSPVPPNNSCCPPPDFSGYESATCTASGETNNCARWVGPPITALESQDLPGIGSYRTARLQCTPYYHDWSGEGLIHVSGAEILPSSSYDVEVFAASCKGAEDTCTAVSDPVAMATRRAGDIASPHAPDAPGQPNALDVTNAVNHFKRLVGAPAKIAAQVQPNVIDPNSDVNALDIGSIVDHLKLKAYPFSGPCTCPSTVPCNTTSCTSPAQCTGTYGAGAMCVKTCTAGPNLDLPCNTNSHCGQCAGGASAAYPCDADADCPGSTCTTGTCGSGFCRDRCGRCGS